jgi:cardiolipin synthase
MSTSGWWGVLVWLLSFGVGVVALGIVPGNRKPSSAMAWLLLIFALPVVGIVLFLLIGGTAVGKRRDSKQAAASAMIRERTAAARLGEGGGPEYVRSVATLNRNLGSVPALPGNAAELFSDYRESIEAMTAEVAGAERFVHVQFYITSWDDVTGPFFDALVRATGRGVRVRLMIDHLGSRGIPGYKDLRRRLDGTSIDWRLMLPVQPLKGKFRRPDLRNHRKILVVDGTSAFMGSQNLVEPGYNKEKNHKEGREWVELSARVTGPAVSALNAVFATD